MRLTPLAIGALALAGHVVAECGKIYQDTDFRGGDLRSVGASRAEDCCTQCQNESICTGFAFAQGTCYLKFGPLERISMPGVSTGAIKASKCSPLEENVDYNGNDLKKFASITNPDECCDKCSANPKCKLYVVSRFGCTLKTKAENRQEGLDPSWNARAAFVQGNGSSATPQPQCGAIEYNVDYSGNDLMRYSDVKDSGECCNLCTKNPTCKLYVSSIFGCSLKSKEENRQAGLDPSWNVRAAFVTTSTSPAQCGPVEKNVDYEGHDLEHFADVKDSAKCCDLCSLNPSCKLFVSSIFGCNLKSAAGVRTANLDHSWNARASFKTSDGSSKPPSQPLKLVSATATPDIRVNPLEFTYVRGTQWFVNSGLESSEDGIEQLLTDINSTLTKSKHGEKPESLIDPTPNGSNNLPFTSVQSIEECVALVSSHGQSYFTYFGDAGVCLGHDFPGNEKIHLLTASSTTVPVARSLPSEFELKQVDVPDEAACIASCKSTSTCVAARKASRCILYTPAVARSTSSSAGWITTPFSVTLKPNLPVFTSASKVHFYTTAHQDDHELFMSNSYHKSISDANTKVVFIYTTAGDDKSGDPWRKARELGTLAASKAWVDHVGQYDSTRKDEFLAIFDHKVQKVTMGNVIHYFLRISENGADGESGFMALYNNIRPVAPMDDPKNHYKDRDTFRATLSVIYETEALGINSIQMNAQDPEGEQPDHEMHLATGQLTWDIVNGHEKWKDCVPQYYYYDYQRWYYDINVDPVVQDVQRYAWLRMSQAIYESDPKVLFWSEHSVNLGRTYVRRSFNENAGPC